MIGKMLRPIAANVKIHEDRYDSTKEFADLSNARKGKHGSSSISDHGGHAWDYGADFDDAYKLAIDGWAEGANRVAKFTGSLISQISQRIVRQEWVPDVEGHYVDLGLFVAREPEYWMRPEEVWSETGSSLKHIRILFNGSASAGIEGKVIETRGAAIVALADLLEVAGHAVTLEGVWAVTSSPNVGGSGGPALSEYVILKHANERCDLAKLMFWTAHPAALRRIVFGYEEGHDFWPYPSYGFPADPRMPENDHEKPDVYMPEAHLLDAAWNTPESAKRWITDTMEQLGVHLVKE